MKIESELIHSRSLHGADLAQLVYVLLIELSGLEELEVDLIRIILAEVEVAGVAAVAADLAVGSCQAELSDFDLHPKDMLRVG